MRQTNRQTNRDKRVTKRVAGKGLIKLKCGFLLTALGSSREWSDFYDK